MAEQKRTRTAATTTPDDYPVAPPPSKLAAVDHSFVLQAIMEVQVSIGKLTEAVETLKAQSASHGAKIEELGRDVHAAKITIRVVGVLLTAAIALAGWLIKSGITEVVKLQLPATTTTTQQPLPPQQR